MEPGSGASHLPANTSTQSKCGVQIQTLQDCAIGVRGLLPRVLASVSLAKQAQIFHKRAHGTQQCTPPLQHTLTRPALLIAAHEAAAGLAAGPALLLPPSCTELMLVPSGAHPSHILRILAMQSLVRSKVHLPLCARSLNGQMNGPRARSARRAQHLPARPQPLWRRCRARSTAWLRRRRRRPAPPTSRGCAGARCGSGCMVPGGPCPCMLWHLFMRGPCAPGRWSSREF